MAAQNARCSAYVYVLAPFVLFPLALRLWSVLAAHLPVPTPSGSEQVLTRSQALFRALLPEDPPVTMRVTQERTPLPHGRHVSYWCVEATDSASKYVGSIRWNIDTGTVSYASCTPPEGFRGGGAPLDSRQIRQAGTHWLQHLQAASLIAPGSGKPVLHAMRRLGRSWMVSWQVQEQRVVLHIDGRSGRLWSAHAYFLTQPLRNNTASASGTFSGES